MYKIFAKVLANRLKKILPSIISETQSAFVSGRSITDNILVAFEILHSMKRNTARKKRDVALRIDISKAYDRIDWGFLQNMMFRLGFSEQWISVIMLGVRTVGYSVLVNSKSVGPIHPQRGLRHGCPLSLYLCIICAQGLSCLIDQAVSSGDIHGVAVCRGAPSVSPSLVRR